MKKSDRKNARLEKGEQAPSFEVKDIHGKRIDLRDFAGQKIFISFYRYGGCPFCNLRLAQLIRRFPEFEKRGLKVIAFWQSSEEEIHRSSGNQNAPFPMIADPAMRIYRLYGVEQSWSGIPGVLRHPIRFLKVVTSDHMNIRVTGEINLVPADFLINPDLKIERAYYGTSIGDHLPMAEIESFLGLGHANGAEL